MDIFSSLLKGAPPARSNTSPADSLSTELDGWKLGLLAKFKTTHYRRPSEFNKLIDDYIFEGVPEDAKPDCSPLLRGCLAFGEARVLQTIWKHGGIKSWCIEGQVKLGEWETLIESSQNGIPIEALKLSNMRFDATTGDMLFKMLGRMPELNSLVLEDVGIEADAFLFKMLECPALKLLEAVEVIALATNFDVCPLLLKILEACQLRRLSIEECVSITADQHVHLAKALGRQERLRSLKLEISLCNSPEQFKCYLQFLRGNTSLINLDLSGCDIGILNCNSLLGALRSKPALASLSLRGCQLLNDSDSERIQILPLAAMPGLRELDLEDNYLADDTLVPLLVALTENKTSCLTHLNLGRNNIGLETIGAMASLLKANGTLLRLSLDRMYSPQRIYTEAELTPLVDALKDNTSLLHLDIGLRIADPTRVRLAELLERNRKILTTCAVKSGMRALALGCANLSFPNELAIHIFEQGLTRREALNLSSVNPMAWGLRQQLLRTGDSSK